jgi:general secretion pathway protein G
MSYDKKTTCITPYYTLLKDEWHALGHVGFTLLELVTVVAIIGILALMAVPSYNEIKDKVRNVRAMEEIRGLEKAINAYSIDKSGTLPDSLADIGQAAAVDPWGRAYVYVPNVATTGRWGVSEQLNTDYDLYSVGHDGASDMAGIIFEGTNADDIIRSENGAFVGVGAKWAP